MLKRAPGLHGDGIVDLADLIADEPDAVNRQLRLEVARLRRALDERADERLSLQALIDRVPDKLWVKDAESRFVIVNKATASEHGKAIPEEMIGETDFDLYASDIAQQFFDIRSVEIEIRL